MTLLEQVNVAIEAGKLDEWLEALSDEDREQFVNEFSSALDEMGRLTHDVLSAVNRFVSCISEALNDDEVCQFCGKSAK